MYTTAIIYVKAATCFDYTYVAIITQLYCIFYSFSYSRSCIQRDDGYTFIAETCSCLYCNSTSFLYIRSEKSTLLKLQVMGECNVEVTVLNGTGRQMHSRLLFFRYQQVLLNL